MVRQELVEHAPEAEDVGAEVDAVPLAPGLFRGHVGWRAAPRAEAAAAQVGRQPEVDQPGGAVVVEDHVGRLDVAVDQAAGVHGGHPLGELREDADDLREIQGPVAPDLGQVAARHVLDDQVRLAVDPLDAVATRDVRADDLRQGPALLGLARRAVGPAVVALEHDVAFEIGVEGQVRGRLATDFGEAAHDLVFPDVNRFSRAWIRFPMRHGHGGRLRRRRGGFEEALRAGRQGVLQQA